MPTLDELDARYQAGETLVFGPAVRLTPDALDYGDASVAIGRIATASWEQDRLVITGHGDEQLLTIPAASIEGVGSLELLINRIAARLPSRERRAPSGWPPGSIGDISAQIGYDVRDLFMAGYSDEQIRRVRTGDRTLEQLMKAKPEGRREHSRGKKPRRRSG